MKNNLVFLFLFISYFASAQLDSIEIELLNYKNSQPEIISKARRLMAEKLVQGDYQKMKEIKDYLKNKINNNHNVTLSSSEYWLILFWTQEFDELLSSVEQAVIQVDEQSMSGNNLKSVPMPDDLFQILLESTFESKHLLELVINNSPLGTEEIDFLQLHLKYCLLPLNNPAITQDSLNIKGDKFILKYPTSPYRPFVKRIIQYKIKVADFGLGYDFFLGYGFFTGKISDNLQDYLPFGFSIDFTYKNFDINLGVGLGLAKLRKEIVYQNIKWEKEMTADIYFPHASIGYTFFGNKQFSFNPFVGIQSLIFTPSYEDIMYYPALESIYLQSDVGVLAGISLNYFTKPFNNTNRYKKTVQFQGFIKLKYSYYQSGFRQDLYGFGGSMHTICLSFGGLMKQVNRI